MDPYEFQPYDEPNQDLVRWYQQKLSSLKDIGADALGAQYMAPPPPAAAAPPPAPAAPPPGPMSVSDVASFRPPFDFQAQPGPVAPAVRPPVDDPVERSRPTGTTALRGAMNRFEEYGPAGPMRAEGFQGLPPQIGDGWSAPVTQGQFAQDAIARDLLSRRSRARLADIDAQEASRGNPMEKQIQADAQLQRYIGGRPAISSSRISASIDGSPIEVEQPDLLSQGLTVDEAIKQRLGERTAQIGAFGKTYGNPQQRSNADLNTRRAQLYDEASQAEAEIRDMVKGGLDPMRAEGMIDRVWDRVREKANALKSGLARDDDPYNLGGPSSTDEP